MAETQYEFGLTPEETGEGIFSALTKGADLLTPLRREVITPPKTTYTEADGAVYKSTTPGEYGEPERGIEYMPVVQGAREAYDVAGKFFTDGKYRAKAADALMTGIGQMFSDYQDVGAQMIADPGPGTTFYDAKEGREVTLDPSLPVGMGMAAGALLPVKGPGMVAGMFAGRHANTADITKLAQAEKMENKGHSRDEIWDQTGWFRFQDRQGKPMGKWKFEIDDSPSRAVGQPDSSGPIDNPFEDPPKTILPKELRPFLTPTGRVKKGSGRTGQGPEISDLLRHNELYKAYSGGGTRLALAEVIRDLSNLNGAVKKLQVRYGRGDLTEPDFRKQYETLLKQKGELSDLLRRGLPPEEVPNAPSKTLREKYPLLDRPIGDTVVESTLSDSSRAAGYYKPSLNVMGVSNPGTDKFRDVALHELQHTIQHREGFEQGGNPSEFKPSFGGGLTGPPFKVVNNPKTGKPLTPVEIYHALVGESEARLVQARRNMEPEGRRALPPYEMIDEAGMFTREELGVERSAGGFVDKPLYDNPRGGYI